MKKQIFILLIGLLFSPLAIGQIHVYSNTTWSNLSLSQDVYIHPGATLNISGNMVFTEGKKIHIYDGGALVGSNGTLTCAQFSKGTSYWEGIVVDPTSSITPSSNWAVDLSNFTVEYAEGAIFCQTSGSNQQTRMVKLNTVSFDKNKFHLRVYNYSTMGSVGSLIYSNIHINGCEFFGPEIGGWAVHIVGTKTLIAINSGFYMDKASIQLHLRSMYNSTVSGNTFDSESPIHVAYHGYNYNCSLSNNEFIVSNPYTSGEVSAVDFGIVHSSQLEKFTISNNTFTTASFSTNKWGIGSIETASNFEDVRIKDNNFTGFGSAIHLDHMNSENTIEKNTFSECSVALDFWDDNPGVDISCNTFNSNDIDILIRSGGTLQDQTPGYDPNNSFSSVSPFNYNIVNQGSVNFYYQYLTSPPNIYTGTGQNVFLLGAPYTQSCSGDSRKTPIASDEMETSKDVHLTLYPNPAESFVKYSIENSSIDQIQILNSLGQTIFSEEISASGGRLDISNLSAGTYIFMLLNEGSIVERDKLVIE